jgi:hypothetical protein
MRPPTSSFLDLATGRDALAKNVEHLRRARGFASTTALAEAATIAKSQLYEILAASCNTSIDNVALLAFALGARACDLLAVI